ncbi:MAG: nitroreductase family protein [Candidatus Puniceispirillaceae bacterium]
MPQNLSDLVSRRFGEQIELDREQSFSDTHILQLQHRSCRRFLQTPVPEKTLRFLFACSLSAPSKSDLQQVSIIHLESKDSRDFIHSVLPSMPWINAAPVFLLFCGDSHRIQTVCEMHKTTFAHDPLDAFFNTATDTAMVLQNFIIAAEAAGLGCCPISAVREFTEQVAEFCQMPDGVYPLAGLCLGYPEGEPDISVRLPMSVFLHKDTYNKKNLKANIRDYDKRREEISPYESQRQIDLYGLSESYGWSSDKARQTSHTERLSFKSYIRKHGFRV